MYLIFQKGCGRMAPRNTVNIFKVQYFDNTFMAKRKIIRIKIIINQDDKKIKINFK